jgi:5-methylcytosine-specific restriction enzyme A
MGDRLGMVALSYGEGPMSQAWRSAPLPPHWDRTRRRILKRDGGICYNCGATGARNVDHKIPVCEGGSEDDWNLGLLCDSCEARKTAAEARRHNPMMIPRKRPEDPHPGRINPRSEPSTLGGDPLDPPLPH